jgi:hypothetical protein
MNLDELEKLENDAREAYQNAVNLKSDDSPELGKEYKDRHEEHKKALGEAEREKDTAAFLALSDAENNFRQNPDNEELKTIYENLRLKTTGK